MFRVTKSYAVLKHASDFTWWKKNMSKLIKVYDALKIRFR